MEGAPLSFPSYIKDPETPGHVMQLLCIFSKQGAHTLTFVDVVELKAQSFISQHRCLRSEKTVSCLEYIEVKGGRVDSPDLTASPNLFCGIMFCRLLSVKAKGTKGGRGEGRGSRGSHCSLN